jgi:hypothetical protein
MSKKDEKKTGGPGSEKPTFRKIVTGNAAGRGSPKGMRKNKPRPKKKK